MEIIHSGSGMTIIYINSDQRTVQGKYDKVKKEYGKEWNIIPHGSGHGNWLLIKKSDVCINGKSCRDFVLKHYDTNRLTKSLAYRLYKDLEEGTINEAELWQ